MTVLVVFETLCGCTREEFMSLGPTPPEFLDIPITSPLSKDFASNQAGAVTMKKRIFRLRHSDWYNTILYYREVWKENG